MPAHEDAQRVLGRLEHLLDHLAGTLRRSVAHVAVDDAVFHQVLEVGHRRAGELVVEHLESFVHGHPFVVGDVQFFADLSQRRCLGEVLGACEAPVVFVAHEHDVVIIRGAVFAAPFGHVVSVGDAPVFIGNLDHGQLFRLVFDEDFEVSRPDVAETAVAYQRGVHLAIQGPYREIHGHVVSVFHQGGHLLPGVFLGVHLSVDVVQFVLYEANDLRFVVASIGLEDTAQLGHGAFLVHLFEIGIRQRALLLHYALASFVPY